MPAAPGDPSARPPETAAAALPRPRPSAAARAFRVVSRAPYRVRRLVLRPVAGVLARIALRWPNATVVATPALIARTASTTPGGATPLAMQLGTGEGVTPGRRRAVIRISEAARMYWVVRSIAAEADPGDTSPEIAGGRAALAMEAGRYSEALAIAAPAVAAGNPTALRVTEDVRGRLGTLVPGWRPPLSGAARTDAPPRPERGRVLHVVSSSLPFRAAGYTVRTAAITACQAAAGLDPRVAVRTGYDDAVADGGRPSRVIDDVAISWLGPKARGVIRVDRQLERSAQQLAALAAGVRPAVIHAHSDYHQAQLALAVSGELGVPAVYEVRGFWEETWASQHELGEATALDSERYRLTREVETAAMLAADAVVTLSGVMRSAIVERGADPGRVFVVPNAVDAGRFTPVERDDRLAARLGIEPGDHVVGYVSSFSGYEGIPYLLEAAARLRVHDPRIRVLLVGDGKALASIEEAAHRLGLDDGTLVMPGRVPHGQIPGYYSLLDVFVVPRTAHRVSSLVTPLKPYEAMALERAVIVSDLPALREVVTPGETGLTFRAEDPDDLAARIGELLADPGLRARLGRQAREWILAERTWAANGRRYRELYERLGAA